MNLVLMLIFLTVDGNVTKRLICILYRAYASKDSVSKVALINMVCLKSMKNQGSKSFL